MPFLIPIIIAVAVAVFATGAVALNWDKIVIALEGKKLAVLGERRVGKTVLIKFLTTGTIPEKYEQTIAREKTVARRFKLKDLSLSIKASNDVPGSKDDYAVWKSITDDADIVLYLLRIDKLMKGDRNTEERVERDIQQVVRWLEKKPKKFPLFIIGTHCDLTKPDLTKLPEDQIGDYQDQVRQMPFFRYIELLGRKGEGEVKVVLGSLKCKSDTKKLVFQIFREVLG